MTTANELKWLIALLHGLPQTDIAEDNNEWHKRLPAGVSSWDGRFKYLIQVLAYFGSICYPRRL